MYAQDLTPEPVPRCVGSGKGSCETSFLCHDHHKDSQSARVTVPLSSRSVYLTDIGGQTRNGRTESGTRVFPPTPLPSAISSSCHQTDTQWQVERGTRSLPPPRIARPCTRLGLRKFEASRFSCGSTHPRQCTQSCPPLVKATRL
jgi:hypothetical protein